MTTIGSDKLILPGGIVAGYIVADAGRIVSVSHTKPSVGGGYIDMAGLYVSPGFVDLHAHGGGSHDFMDGGAACIEQAALAHRAHGTTTLLPTTLAAAWDEVYAFLDSLRIAQERLSGMMSLPGTHLEGPYFNPAQAGAQDQIGRAHV